MSDEAVEKINESFQSRIARIVEAEDTKHEKQKKVEYKVRWCDNARCANRGWGKDHYYTTTIKARSDEKAILKAAKEVFDWDDEDLEEIGIGVEDLKNDILDFDDCDGGRPVIFWIKRGSTFILGDENREDIWRNGGEPMP